MAPNRGKPNPSRHPRLVNISLHTTSYWTRRQIFFTYSSICCSVLPSEERPMASPPTNNAYFGCPALLWSFSHDGFNASPDTPGFNNPIFQVRHVRETSLICLIYNFQGL